jgi:hypothetical protein
MFELKPTVRQKKMTLVRADENPPQLQDGFKSGSASRPVLSSAATPHFDLCLFYTFFSRRPVLSGDNRPTTPFHFRLLWSPNTLFFWLRLHSGWAYQRQKCIASLG